MNMEKKEICKHFLKNKCIHNNKCKFIHDKDICKNYFFEGKCKRNSECKFKHTNILKKNIKNTTNFKPSYDLSSMNILVGKPNEDVFYKNNYNVNDLIIIPNFLSDNNIYNKLLDEIKKSGIDEAKLWKLWHGDNHMIADDNLNWKDKVPTFQFILDSIEKYFHMKIKSNRFNYYKNSNDWKPFHHDAAAIKEDIAKLQNFTVGVSFGATKDIAFEHANNKTIISIPLSNGFAYAFSKDININWKHGVPQINPDFSFEEGRISVIAWGKVTLV